MRVYEILKYFGKEKPVENRELLIQPDFKSYYSPACTLTIDGNNFTVEGPDKEAVKYVKDLLKRNYNNLFIERGRTLKVGHAHEIIPVPMTDEKRFPKALEDSLDSPYCYKYPEMNLEPMEA